MKVWNSDTDNESLEFWHWQWKLSFPPSFLIPFLKHFFNRQCWHWFLEDWFDEKCNGMICMISKYLVIYDETGSPVVHINGAVATAPTLVAQAPPDWPLEKALATWKINMIDQSQQHFCPNTISATGQEMPFTNEPFLRVAFYACDKSYRLEEVCNLERVAPHQPASCPQIPKADNKWCRPKNVR